MSIIKINYSDMESTISCYEKSINTLKSDLDKLNSNMNSLKSEWKGEAQKAFFSNIYQNFETAMKKDIEHLTFLKEQLKSTKKAFEEVDNKYKNLKIKK